MLQKFDFVPCSTKTEVEVGAEAGDQGEVVLWSADAVQLRATFSKRYLKTQNMVSDGAAITINSNYRTIARTNLGHPP